MREVKKRRILSITKKAPAASPEAASKERMHRERK
jgi:hypothetical protein